MTDEKEIDIDAMSDDDFQKFKAEIPEEEAPKEEEQASPDDDSDEQPGDDGDEGEGGEKRSDTVSHGRFHKEREMRKARENELAEIRNKYETMEQRFSALLTGLQQQRQPQAHQMPVEQPKPLEERYNELLEQGDLVGANKVLLEKVKQFDSEREQQTKAYQQQVQEQQVVHQIRATVAQGLERAEQIGMPAREALNHLLEQGVKTYMAQGMSQQQAVAQAQYDADRSFYGILSKGGDPIKTLLSVAEARGFSPTKKKAEQEFDTSAIDEIERRNGVKSAAKSLGKGGSEGASRMPKAEDILEMSDAEFEKFKAKYGENAISNLLSA